MRGKKKKVKEGGVARLRCFNMPCFSALYPETLHRKRNAAECGKRRKGENVRSSHLRRGVLYVFHSTGNGA